MQAIRKKKKKKEKKEEIDEKGKKAVRRRLSRWPGHVAQFRRTADEEKTGFYLGASVFYGLRLTRDAVKYATDRARFSPCRPASRSRAPQRVPSLRFLFSLSLLSFRGSFY